MVDNEARIMLQRGRLEAGMSQLAGRAMVNFNEGDERRNVKERL